MTNQKVKETCVICGEQLGSARKSVSVKWGLVRRAQLANPRSTDDLAHRNCVEQYETAVNAAKAKCGTRHVVLRRDDAGVLEVQDVLTLVYERAYPIDWAMAEYMEECAPDGLMAAHNTAGQLWMEFGRLNQPRVKLKGTYLSGIIENLKLILEHDREMDVDITREYIALVTEVHDFAYDMDGPELPPDSPKQRAIADKDVAS